MVASFEFITDRVASYKLIPGSMRIPPLTCPSASSNHLGLGSHLVIETWDGRFDVDVCIRHVLSMQRLWYEWVGTAEFVTGVSYLANPFRYISLLRLSSNSDATFWGPSITMKSRRAKGIDSQHGFAGMQDRRGKRRGWSFASHGLLDEVGEGTFPGRTREQRAQTSHPRPRSRIHPTPMVGSVGSSSRGGKPS